MFAVLTSALASICAQEALRALGGRTRAWRRAGEKWILPSGKRQQLVAMALGHNKRIMGLFENELVSMT